MKQLILLGGILNLSIMIFSNLSYGQCNTELYINKSIKSLRPGFQFSKSFRIDGKGGIRRRVQYTAVFSKDTNYMIKISGKDGAANGIIGTLSDSRNNKLVSSFYNNKFLDGWQYKCRSTGIYRLTFTFKDSEAFCGSAVLAFKR